MTSRLFLVRHGAVNVEAAGFCQGAIYGCFDVPLSVSGEAEAKAAAKYLSTEHRIDRVFSSPMARAQFGANCIAKDRNIDVHVEDGFREVDRGHWCGHSWEDIMEKFPGERELFETDLDWKSHGGETYREVRARVLAARDRSLLQEGTTVLVSHNFVTKAIVADAMGVDIPHWSQIDIPTASISLLEFDKDGSVRIKYTGFKPPNDLATQADQGSGG